MSKGTIELIPIEYDVLIMLLNNELKTKKLKINKARLIPILTVLRHNKKQVCKSMGLDLLGDKT